MTVKGARRNLPVQKGPKKDSDGGNGDSKNSGGGGRNNGGKGGKGKDKKNGNQYYGGFGGYKGVKKKKAERMAQDEIRDILQAMRREMKSARREYKDMRGDIREDYRQTKADTEHIFGESGEFIGNQNAILDQRFADAAGQQSAAQAALMSQLGSSGALGGASSDLSALGMDPSQFMGGAQGDQDYAAQMAALMGGNNNANLAAMAASSGSIGDLLLGMNAGGQATALNQALRGKNESMEDLGSDFRDFRYDMRQQRVDAKKQKGGLTREILQELASLGWGQYVDQRNLNQNQQQINMQKRAMAQQAAAANAYSSQQAAYSSTLANGLGSVYGSTGAAAPAAPAAPQRPQSFGDYRNKRNQVDISQQTYDNRQKLYGDAYGY